MKIKAKTGTPPCKFSQTRGRGRPRSSTGPTAMLYKLKTGEAKYLITTPISDPKKAHSIRSNLHQAARNQKLKIKTHTTAKKEIVVQLKAGA
jgi:hypothetical protein